MSTVHPPNITAAYLNQSLYGVGDQAVFVCKGEGFGRLHFKWQRQSENISTSAVMDMDTGILTMPELSSSDEGNYRCVISDEQNATVYSEYIRLNVSEGGSITHLSGAHIFEKYLPVVWGWSKARIILIWFLIH